MKDLNKNYVIGGAFALLLVLSTVAYGYWGNDNRQARYDYVAPDASTTPAATTTEWSPVSASATTTQPQATQVPAATPGSHAYGTVVLGLNQSATFPSKLTITPTAVLEDSRCPLGVMCIQAGTLRLSIQTRSSAGARVIELKPGGSIKVGSDSITFSQADPIRRHSPIPDSDYRFTFDVEPLQGTVSNGPCYVGGCSREVCSDDPAAVSNCMYSPQYACYKSATCERQSTGKCGWTETPALAQCLANPPAST